MISRTLSAILFFEGLHLELTNIAFHFSLLRRELVILPSRHLTVNVSSSIMSRPSKEPQLLQSSEISGLIVDTNSDEVRVSSNISSVERGSERVPEVSQPQLCHQTASCHESSSSVLTNACDKEDAGESRPDEQTQQPVTLQWTCPSCPQSSVVHIQEAPEERTTKHQT